MKPRAPSHADEAAAEIRRRCPSTPLVGLILGSGLGDLADRIVRSCRIPFAEVPHHPTSSVAGHAGLIVLGELEGVTVVAWHGRIHFYEGRTMVEAAFPIRVMAALGVRGVVLSNAAGGLGQGLQAGDLMLIQDHINLPGLTGHNPLRGPSDPNVGERFVDLTQAYDPEFREIARRVSDQLGIRLQEGIYAMVAGPNYETPAEGRLLRQLGADAVGMSTVPEVIAARQAGLRVLAISAITNVVLSPTEDGTSHAEVLAAADKIKPRFESLIRGVMPELRRAFAG